MKLKVNRTFKYQADARTVVTIKPGTYNVPDELSQEAADKVMQFRAGELIVAKKPVQKKAPENKVRGRTPDSKTPVAKPASSRGSAGAKSKR